MRRLGSICGALLLSLPLFAVDRIEEDPINYSDTEPDNSVSRLQADIDSGKVALEHDDKFGYLKAVLDHLDIPRESQVLVFSKTSLQSHAISPSTPRAVYFNDDVYVGTVRNGGLLEVSTADPNLGAVFYALSQDKNDRPEFVRQGDTCLQCHNSTITRGVPGHVVRSVFPDDEGFAILRAGTYVTTQASPFEKRWGGWYVTGTHGQARHMGNMIATATEHGAEIDMEAGANRRALDGRVNPAQYLTPHSDIVALMVLEHQTRMHNLITRANFETRQALHDQAVVDGMLGREPEKLNPSTKRRISNIGRKLVDHMLFVDEIELESPVAGTSGFVEAFSAAGPKDSNGRSLREFDLEERMFKYPLSFLIYSEQFDGLPQEMKAYVYRRLWDILAGADDSDDYLHLTNAKCRAIREILVDTKPDLPLYWTSDSSLGDDNV